MVVLHWYLNDKSGRFFLFQFTLVNAIVYVVSQHILKIAVPDFETGEHYDYRQAFFLGRNINITPDLIGVSGPAEIRLSESKLDLSITAKDYSLSLEKKLEPSYL